MKRSFGRIEAVFDSAYLLSALFMGALLLIGQNRSELARLAGVMALVLALGDLFHLLPRILSVFTAREEPLYAAMGRGKQVTSITMTVFYLLLWKLGLMLFSVAEPFFWSAAVLAVAAARIILCLLPQNRWRERFPPVRWSILRNIPFFLLGVGTARLYFLHRGEAPGLTWMWLAILLSFAFYAPVVLWANKNPKLGMLMLPKTCMYLWMLGMCFSL